MALTNAVFILTMLEKCHHFTLTESLATEQNINLLVAGLEFKKKEMRMEEVDIKNRKFGFSLLIKFSPLYFYKSCHLS